MICNPPESQYCGTRECVTCGPEHELQRNPDIMAQRAKRITRLIEKPRMMTPEAAATVVDAAMFGIGCTEGQVRAAIQVRLDKGLPPHVPSEA